MSSRSFIPVGLALATLAFASAAEARPHNPNAGQRHDPGHFFVRLSGGFGFSSATFDDPGETTLSGFGGMGSFKFGATIARNVALGVDLFGLSMFEPSVTVNGDDLGSAEGTRASMGAIGLGGTFYIMPANLYIAASAGVGLGTIEFRGRFGGIVVTSEEDSRPGFAANVMIGKEWWVSRKWGIGLAGQLIFASLETDDDVGLGVFGAGLLFSATMN
ncbi:MAG TPA: hypothetical protein PK095_10150 [Myxococcota bacterium]|nr:hypothetical protein [Myxococcota bacterium]